MTDQQQQQQQPEVPSSEDEFDEEWEEWDGKSPFLHHCIAGSLAGVAEHVMVYPLDTVRTHIQVCAACEVKAPGTSALEKSLQQAKAGHVSKSSSSIARAAAARTASTTMSHPMANYGMWQVIRHLVSQPVALESANATAEASVTSDVTAAAQKQMVGFTRLWRGVQTILIGCIPAHALYFSSYEIVKAATLDPTTKEVTTYGSVLAGAAAVFGHDVILAPLDTVKQRLQLGHYRGFSHALQTMVRSEGWVSLYRSFPVTLATNLPYGMVMVSVNEFLKQQWTTGNIGGGVEPGHHQPLTLPVTLGASAFAGLTAAATTTPLDRVKTFLQTQQLTPTCSIGAPPESCPLKSSAGSSKPVVSNWSQATARIYATEGAAGFFRGMAPRILSHTPAVAISWTTYETAKQYLKSLE